MTEDTIKKYMAAMEAILFTMGKSISSKVLSETLEITESEVEDIAAKLSESYESEDRGIRIQRLEDHYQLLTKTEYYDYLIKIAKRPVKPNLTETVLEVLSIIAYKQPVTKGEIERIRGVSSDYAVNRLVEYGLVEEAGRLDAPGRPILFKTTEEFLRLFGITSAKELPEPDEETKEKAKLQAYMEAREEGILVEEDVEVET